jgi:hypothetical protein
VVARVFALLVALAFVPAFGELVETLVHVAEYGDSVHGASAEDGAHRHHDATPLGADEHGCSPMLHLCGCHAPAPALPDGLRLAAPLRPSTRGVAPTSTLRARAGLGALAPPIRPPIA